MPTYTKDFVSQHANRMRNALKEFIGAPCHMLELGTFEGRSAAWFLDEILTHPESHLTTVDPYCYPANYTARCALAARSKVDDVLDVAKRTAAANLAAYGDRVSMVCMESFHFLRACDNTYDAIYIDGNHHSAWVMEDAVLAWRLLKVKGIMMFDDYKWGKNKPARETPRLATDTFIEMHKHDGLPLKRGKHVYIVKTC